MRFMARVFIWILLFNLSLYAQVTLPPRVSAELALLGDVRINAAIEQGKYRECLEMLAKDLKPVSEGKFKTLDAKHKIYVSQIRMLRLMLNKDMFIDATKSNSVYKKMFPNNKIRSFWLWMSRDEYFFPSINEQARLIAKWKEEISRSNVETVDWNIDINEWWF